MTSMLPTIAALNLGSPAHRFDLISRYEVPAHFEAGDMA